MKALLPPGWPRPKGYANGISASGRLDRHRRRDRLERREERFDADDLAGQFRQILLNTLAILAEDGAGPEHIVRMTWYVTDIAEYRASLAEIGAAYARADRPQLPGHGGGRRRRAGRARRRRSRSRRSRWCPNDRQLHPRPAAAAGSAARIPLHLPELQYPERLNAAVELIDRQDPDALAVAQRCRRLDLWRDEGPLRPDRPPAGRAGGPRPRQPRLPARAQQRDAVRLLARRAQGRRRGRRHHADAPPRRDRDDPRARAGQPRHRRRPLPRRFRRRRRRRLGPRL